MKSTLRLYEHECLRCGYTWAGRIEKPRSCAQCKSYLWHKAKVARKAKVEQESVVESVAAPTTTTTTATTAS
jgi:hypothetical protein